MLTFNELIQGDLPVLVDFYADWCGPCKTLDPIVREVAREISNKVTTIKVNVDNSPQVAQAYHVTGIPTLILFRHGKVLWRQTGLVNKSTLLAAIGPHLIA
ncbi:thioredoxin [Paraflavitalea speifideaquila]|uniref:thioredoxin n=1 Tax=Paraflavitalea speifideaquila TaxID=3076558 RepID=UPI0028ECC9DF|nr:thioredoxin [Paraflavitalea speifideiaquila]